MSVDSADHDRRSATPVLLGHGRPSLCVPLAPTLAESPRPPTRVEPLGDDWLFDCDVSG